MPRAGGGDKYGGTKLHDTTYADSRAGAASCSMTAILPARLLCRNEYEQAPLSYRGSGTYDKSEVRLCRSKPSPKSRSPLIRKSGSARPLYRVTSVFSGEKRPWQDAGAACGAPRHDGAGRSRSRAALSRIVTDNQPPCGGILARKWYPRYHILAGKTCESHHAARMYESQRIGR